MIIRADLHVHSLASADGSSTTRQLAAQAKARGLAAIAVTDHDACTPLPERSDVLLIPAVELSTDRGHVLGLFLQRPISGEFLRGYPPLDACVAEIRRCGGAAVLAHPFAPQKLEQRELQSLSLDAVETANARAALRLVLGRTLAAHLISENEQDQARGTAHLYVCFSGFVATLEPD